MSLRLQRLLKSRNFVLCSSNNNSTTSSGEIISISYSILKKVIPEKSPNILYWGSQLINLSLPSAKDSNALIDCIDILLILALRFLILQ